MPQHAKDANNSATAAPPQLSQERARALKWRKVKQFRFLYILILPVIAYFLVFSFYPLVLGIVQSFQKTKLLGNKEFVAFENYVSVWRDRKFQEALRNSFIVGMLSTLATLFSALILAFLIQEIHHRRLRSFVQTSVFLPFLFSWTVVGGLWIYILSSRGLANALLDALGYDKVLFMSRPELARPIFILTAAWKNAGYNALLLIAAMVAVTPEMYEAAQIDGASRIQQLWYLTLPVIRPTFITLFILGMTGLLRNFDQVYVMGNAAIWPKVRSLLYFIFEEGILNFDLGRSTAAATYVLIFSFVLTQVSRRLLKPLEEI